MRNKSAIQLKIKVSLCFQGEKETPKNKNKKINESHTQRPNPSQTGGNYQDGQFSTRRINGHSCQRKREELLM